MKKRNDINDLKNDINEILLDKSLKNYEKKSIFVHTLRLIEFEIEYLEKLSNIIKRFNEDN